VIGGHYGAGAIQSEGQCQIGNDDSISHVATSLSDERVSWYLFTSLSLR
jgi:hypothetical protein